MYIRYFKELKFFLFEPKFSFIYILLATFLVQQFIYTGCLFFPADFSCFNVSWFNESNLSLSGGLELVNKSYFHEAKDIYTPEEYLKNFNWIFFWIKRNYIEISEHLFTIILPSILFLFFLKNRENNFFLIDKFGLYIFLILGFLFWLNFSPVYRFGIYLFLTLIYVILINYLLSKKFSKILFLVFFVIFVFFSFSKNLLRINKTESIFLGIQKIDNKYTINEKYQNKYINVHHPDIKKNSMNGWQGRLCWNTPFICSYNKLDVRKKNGYLIINKLIN